MASASLGWMDRFTDSRAANREIADVLPVVPFLEVLMDAVRR